MVKGNKNKKNPAVTHAESIFFEKVRESCRLNDICGNLHLRQLSSKSDPAYVSELQWLLDRAQREFEAYQPTVHKAAKDLEAIKDQHGGFFFGSELEEV
jgi:hypothetical protein